MSFLVSTYVDVYRDVNDEHDVDAFGDATVTGLLPILTDVPASVALDASRRGNPADLDETQVDRYTVRVGGLADVRPDDRVHDKRTGAWYQVQTISQPQAVVGLASRRLVCTRVGAPA